MIVKRISGLLKPRYRRYIFVGSIVYCLELLSIIVAQSLGASALLAVGLSFWIGLIISFVLQKLITFNDKRMHHHILLPQFGASILLVMFNFGFTLIVTRVLQHALPAPVCRTLALGATTVWNYYLYKTHIFSSPSQA